MKKRLQGTIVSTKMQKTAVVEVARWKTARIYNKRLKVVKKFLADNPEDKFKTGEFVAIEECMPISKNKHFRVIETLKK